jgi:hypothetical protein
MPALLPAPALQAINRDFNAGYKQDMGWIPDTRVATVGDQLGDADGGLITLGAVDSGSLSRNAQPLALRLRHFNSDPSGDRFWYASFRGSRSTTLPQGATWNDVPFKQNNAGNSKLLDTTPGTSSQQDAGIAVGQAAVIAALDGDYLVEGVSYARQPAASADARDGQLTMRVNRLSTVTQAGSGAAVPITPDGLGCSGVACQPAPVPVAVTTTCISSGAGLATALSVPVTELGFPSVFGVTDASVSATSSAGYAAGISATLCLPAGTSPSSVRLTLAGYDSLPVAEMLTGSPLGRGNEFYPSTPLFYPGFGYNFSCATLSLMLPAGTTKYIAAAARWNGSALASAASAPPPLSLRISCAASVAGAATTVYGVPAAVASPTRFYFTFANAFFNDVYEVSRVRPYGYLSSDGMLQYDSAGQAFRAVWRTGSWWLNTWTSDSSYYLQEADAAKTDLFTRTSFGGTFAATRLCPFGSYVYGGGCLSCPPRSTVRGGASLTALSAVSSTCFCVPGYYMGSTADAAGRFSCTACPPNTYDETAGGVDATSCLPCPAGTTSPGGSARCSASTALAVAPSLPYRLCSRLHVANWRAGYGGTYALNATLAALGHGRLVYAMEGAATPTYLVYWGAAGLWTFGSTPDGGVGITVTSGRMPPYWTTAVEWTPAYPSAAAACVAPSGAPVNVTAGDYACPAGQEPDARGFCQPCAVGTFRSALLTGAGARCTACPAGLTTRGSGATLCDVFTCGAVDVTWTAASGTPSSAFSGRYNVAYATAGAPAQGTKLSKADGTAYYIYASSDGASAYLDNDAAPTAYYAYTNAGNRHPWLATAGWQMYLSGAWVAATPTFRCAAGANGFYYSSASSGLVACPTGYTPPAATPATSSAGCTACAAGYRRDAASNTCVACGGNTFSDGTATTSCPACPAGTSTNGATAQAACSCASGYALSGGVCADVDECATSNGGCSDTCTNTAGDYACSCPAGWGLDAATLSTCSACPDGSYVDAATGVCAACSAQGLTRTASGVSCGCPFGFVVTSGGACLPPSDLILDAPASAAAAIRGRYVACAPPGSAATGTLAWEWVSGLPGAATPSDDVFLVYNPATGTWAVQAQSAAPSTTDGLPAPRYAYIQRGSVTASAAWPASVAYGASGNPSSLATSTAGMLPAGLQAGWQVYAPWPAAFSVASLHLNASLTVVTTALPACGTVTSANAASVAGAAGASTLGGGSALVAGLTPSSTASPSAATVSAASTQTPTGSPASSGTPSPSSASTLAASAASTQSPSMSAAASVSPTQTSTSSKVGAPRNTRPSA